MIILQRVPQQRKLLLNFGKSVTPEQRGAMWRSDSSHLWCQQSDTRSFGPIGEGHLGLLYMLRCIIFYIGYT